MVFPSSPGTLPSIAFIVVSVGFIWVSVALIPVSVAVIPVSDVFISECAEVENGLQLCRGHRRSRVHTFSE